MYINTIDSLIIYADDSVLEHAWQITFLVIKALWNHCYVLGTVENTFHTLSTLFFKTT